MPPKMRKWWMHREVKSRLQWEVSQLQAAAVAKEIIAKDFDGRAVDPSHGLAIRFKGARFFSVFFSYAIADECSSCRPI